MAQLRRSTTNRKLLGVCGGLAEYLGVDPTLVRLGVIVMALLGGPGLLAYLICGLVMPSGHALPSGYRYHQLPGR